MGYIFAIISAITFGMSPLLALSLMREGLALETVLFYRFFFATIFLGALLFLRRERFRLKGRDLGKAALLSFFYTASALLYYWGFTQAPSGLSTTLHFTYPLMVMLLMILFFKEKFSVITFAALTLALSGVALLMGVEQGGQNVSIFAIIILLGSALANGIYITGLHAARVPYISSLMSTFYLLLFGVIYTLCSAYIRGAFQWVVDPVVLGNLFILAMVTAGISNATLVLAVKRIGSTTASLLGAVEPLTAVVIGVLVFDEPFTAMLVAGVACILGSVTVVMLGPSLWKKMRHQYISRKI